MKDSDADGSKWIDAHFALSDMRGRNNADYIRSVEKRAKYEASKLTGRLRYAMESNLESLEYHIRYAMPGHRQDLMRRSCTSLANSGGFRLPRVWEYIARWVRESREFAQHYGWEYPLPTDYTDLEGNLELPPIGVLTPRDCVYLRRYFRKKKELQDGSDGTASP